MKALGEALAFAVIMMAVSAIIAPDATARFIAQMVRALHGVAP